MNQLRPSHQAHQIHLVVLELVNSAQLILMIHHHLALVIAVLQTQTLESENIVNSHLKIMGA